MGSNSKTRGAIIFKRCQLSVALHSPILSFKGVNFKLLKCIAIAIAVHYLIGECAHCLRHRPLHHHTDASLHLMQQHLINLWVEGASSYYTKIFISIWLMSYSQHPSGCMSCASVYIKIMGIAKLYLRVLHLSWDDPTMIQAAQVLIICRSPRSSYK